jgi:hypothetical protein
MTLEIEIRIDGTFVAFADASNDGRCAGDASLFDYVIQAQTAPSPVTGAPETAHAKFYVIGHKREQSAWALVAKVATHLAQRENGADPGRVGLTTETPDEMRPVALEALDLAFDNEPPHHEAVDEVEAIATRSAAMPATIGDTEDFNHILERYRSEVTRLIQRRVDRLNDENLKREYTEIIDKAVEEFGDAAEMQRWMFEPARALDYAKP